MKPASPSTNVPGAAVGDAAGPTAGILKGDESEIVGGLRQDLSACVSEIRELRQEIMQLREALTAERTRLDGIEERVAKLEERQTTDVPGRTAELERTITQLRHELNDRDQEALLSDLEIGQLPEEKGENTVHSVKVLAAQLGVALEERDVVFAERVGAPPGGASEGRARRVVVRLARRHLRDELLQAARVRRSVAGAAGGRIFLNERLTRPNRQLFYRVREECRRLQWRYSWTKRGRIFARQDDGKPAFQLRTQDDFTRVFGPQAV